MKVAVILFNLGGPDRQEAVEPFLFNLFNDRAIISLPQPLRWLVAKLISRRRGAMARANYAKMGGGSPILPQTQAQAQALEKELNQSGPTQWRCFIAMRYWHPRAAETARQVKQWGADFVVLLPLYPQYSTTTTASSFKEWRQEAQRAGLDAPSHALCCYPAQDGLIAAMAANARLALLDAAAAGLPRALFSAHGLPQKVIDGGDPYREQIEETADALAARLELAPADWRICYQSRVGPLAWIKPYTEDEIAAAGAEKKPLAVIPVAFVSEHVETLVELDEEYRHLAAKAGVPAYARAATVGTEPRFIAGLAALARQALARGPGLASDLGKRRCSGACAACPMAGPAATA